MPSMFKCFVPMNTRELSGEREVRTWQMRDVLRRRRFGLSRKSCGSVTKHMASARVLHVYTCTCYGKCV